MDSLEEVPSKDVNTEGVHFADTEGEGRQVEGTANAKALEVEQASRFSY